MKDLIESILGANWRTTLSGHLGLLAIAVLTRRLALPADWHDPNQVVTFACWGLALLSGSAFSIHAKDAVVSGNGTVNRPYYVADNAAGSRPLAPLLPVIAMLMLVAALAGCANGRYVGPKLVFGANYQLPNGEGAVGGSVELDPTFAKQKK